MKPIELMTSKLEPVDYIAGIGIMIARANIMTVKTIDYVADAVMNGTVGDHLKGNLVLDKYTSSRRITKDAEFEENRGFNSFMSYLPVCKNANIDDLKATMNRVSLKAFGRPVDVHEIVDMTTNQYIVEINNKSQTDVLGSGWGCGASFPKQGKFLFIFDHYYCDGEIYVLLVQEFYKVLGIHIIPTKTLVPNIYIPVISDAYIARFGKRLLDATLEYPSLNRIGRPLTSVYSKSVELKHSGRWYSYASTLYIMFELTDRPYIVVTLTALVNMSRFFTNNHAGFIPLLLHRPTEMSVDKKESNLIALAAEIERQCTENYMDIISTYDMGATFTSNISRKLLGFNNRSCVDVVLTAFHIRLDESKHIHGKSIVELVDESSTAQLDHDCGGSFGGSIDFPLVYIGSTTINSTLAITMNSNVADIDPDRFIELYDGKLSSTFPEITKPIH